MNLTGCRTSTAKRMTAFNQAAPALEDYLSKFDDL